MAPGSFGGAGDEDAREGLCRRAALAIRNDALDLRAEDLLQSVPAVR